MSLTLATEEASLVGRCFVILCESDGRLVVNFQGIVRAHLPGDHLLIQFFDAIVGEPASMAVVPTDAVHWSGARRAGSWIFFEDDAHLRFWMDSYNRNIP